jgi:hypothetical protein
MKRLIKMLRNIKKVNVKKMLTIITELDIVCKKRWCLFLCDTLFIYSTVVTHCSLFTVQVGRSSTGSFWKFSAVFH